MIRKHNYSLNIFEKTNYTDLMKLSRRAEATFRVGHFLARFPVEKAWDIRVRPSHVENADYVPGMRGVKSNASVFHDKRNAGQLFLCWKKDIRTLLAGNCLFLNFMFKMLLLLASMSCIIQHSFAYNIETELPVIRRGDAGSYFGFSVANHAFEDFFIKNQSW